MIWAFLLFRTIKLFLYLRSSSDLVICPHMSGRSFHDPASLIVALLISDILPNSKDIGHGMKHPAAVAFFLSQVAEET
jgi:hypothetical protein